MSQRRFDRSVRQRENAEQRRQSVRLRRAGIAAGAVGAAVLLTPGAASAAPFEVSTLTDEASDGECVTDCTLREAIALANANGEADTITFAASLGDTLTLSEGQLTLNTNDGAIAIQGPGASDLTISGNNLSRIFNITGGGQATISGLTLTDGDGSANGPGAPDRGGAIVSQANLTLVDTVITGNTAPVGGGLSTSDINSAPTTLTNTDVTDNEATGDAGGIDSRAQLTLNESSVTGNTAGSNGGGIKHATATKYTSLTVGPDDLTITDSSVSDNEAGSEGGGIFINYRDFQLTDAKYIDAEGDVTITRSTIDGNQATQSGGGINVERLANDNDFTVRESTVSRNTVEEGPEDDPPDRATRAEGDLTGTGGGIDFDEVRAAAAQVKNSTVADNGAGTGGGIFIQGVQLTRSAGADTRVDAPAPSLNVDNTTVASNEGAVTGGGIAMVGFGTNAENGVGLSSTIVADNAAGSADKDLSTTQQGFTSVYGLVETPGSATLATDGSKPTITGQDPQLGTLNDNGGPTETKLLAASSPAVDKGTANGLSGEQRGTSRTIDLSPANASDATDVGAVEISSQPAGTTPSTPTPALPVTPSATPSICGRRAISLIRADRRGSKVKLTGLVGAALYGKTVTIQTDPKGAKSSAFTRMATVRASRTGNFSATVPAPDKDDVVTVRYRAKAGSSTSPALKLPQSLTSRSVKSARGTITVTGKVKKSVLGKRNRVKIRRLVCGRYRTVGSAKPDENGNYKITFRATEIRGVSLYRAESRVLRKAGSKVYVIQYARAIAIRTTSQTG